MIETNGIIESNGGVLEASDEVRSGSRFGDFLELTKPRLTMLSVLTTLAGFYVATTGELALMRLSHTLIGTFLVGGGCGALNMYVEREHDRKMRRTMNRPIPSGKVSAAEALAFGIALAVIGIGYLALTVNLLTALLAAATVASYIFWYTPMKRRSTLNTVIGGIPGAIPPVMGWAAVRGSLGPESLALFGVLFFWQMPHFLALAWMYRKDYERAGYKMLPVVDQTGSETSRQILLYTAALLPVSLIPTLTGVAGAVYFFGALLLGIGFLVYGGVLARSRQNAHAKWLFYYSLLYLPILFLVMALDRGPM
jgi:protoheme IX farnesyltransferase